MSSPDVESPYSMYNYPSRVSLSPPQVDYQHPPQPSQPQIERRAPRLPSPHIFRDIFGPDGSGPSSRRANLDLPPVNFRETMNGVNQALQSVNRAVQNAQEAFQTRNAQSTHSSGRPDVVDLTDSPPSAIINTSATAPAPAIDEAAEYHNFLSRFSHPHDSNSRTTNILQQPVYGAFPARRLSEDNPHSFYSGPDSAAGPARRYLQLRNHSSLTMPSVDQLLGRQDARDRDEQAAIRRQAAARQQWQDMQNRTEQQRLEAQRQRLLASPTNQRTQPSQSSPQSHSNDLRASSPLTDKSVEAVDLTAVEDDPTLEAALSKQRTDAIISQNSTNNVSADSSSAGRTPLSSYKCPICMEPPENATSTSCGHLFCHKCIIDTLKWSERSRAEEVAPGRKVKGVCPVCRKELNRNENSKQGRNLVALEIRLISKKELKRKRDEEDLAAKKNDKGKGRADFKRDLTDLEGDGDLNDTGSASKRAKITVAKSEDIEDGFFSFDDENFSIF